MSGAGTEKDFSFIFLAVCVCVGLSEMVTETASSPGPFRNTQMSKAAQTHKLRKLRAPSKCRECDSLVVFHGAECEEVSASVYQIQLLSGFPPCLHVQYLIWNPVSHSLSALWPAIRSV